LAAGSAADPSDPAIAELPVTAVLLLVFDPFTSACLTDVSLGGDERTQLRGGGARGDEGGKIEKRESPGEGKEKEKNGRGC